MTAPNTEEGTLRTQIKLLRDKGGCEVNINGAPELVKCLRCKTTASRKYKSACLLTIIKHFFPKEAEPLLLGLNFLKGYEKIDEVDQRRKKYYQDCFPYEECDLFSDEDWKRITDRLRKREDALIEKLLAILIAPKRSSELLEILKKAPKQLRLVTPRPQKQQKLLEVPHNIPPKNPNFCKERKKLLPKIWKALNKNNIVLLSQTISSLGGVGKTQLAIEYAHKYRTEFKYSVIWWLTADNDKALYSSATEFVKCVDLIEYILIKLDEGDLHSPIFSMRQWLNTHTDWLLIFDNVEDWELIQPFLPQKNNGHILITSRLSLESMKEKVNIEQIDIDVYDKEKEAIPFLLTRTKIQDPDNAAILAERLGCFPLALEQAGAYITTVPGMDFNKYIEQMDKFGFKEFRGYKDAVWITLKIAMEKIQMESAKQLLFLSAYFAPHQISLSIFISEAKWIEKVLEMGGHRREWEISELLCSYLLQDKKRDQLIHMLTQYALIRCDSHDNLYIHQLLQEVIRDELVADTYYIRCCRHFNGLIFGGNLFHNVSVMSKEYPEYKYRCKSHFSCIFQHAKRIGIKIEKA